ncbi:MAG: hypothetical protein ABIH66_07940 [bacterium]
MNKDNVKKVFVYTMYFLGFVCIVLFLLIIIVGITKPLYGVFNQYIGDNINSILSLSRTLIALISFFGMLTIFYLNSIDSKKHRAGEAQQRKRRFYLKGKETKMHAFVSRFFSHVDTKLYHVYCRKTTYEINKDSIWLALDDIYKNPHEDFIRGRRVFERALKNWIGISSIEEFRQMDIEIRESYGIWKPPVILQDFAIENKDETSCGYCGLIIPITERTCDNCPKD